MRPLSFWGGSFGFQSTSVVGDPLSVVSSVGLRGGDFGAVRNALFLLGAQTAIRAEVAVDAGLRIEDAVRNALGRGFDPIARGDQV